jgi:hypothetical protein
MNRYVKSWLRGKWNNDKKNRNSDCVAASKLHYATLSRGIEKVEFKPASDKRKQMCHYRYTTNIAAFETFAPTLALCRENKQQWVRQKAKDIAAREVDSIQLKKIIATA